MKPASTILMDGAGVRWPAPELLLWLNEGIREIAAAKPNAVTAPVTLTLVAGVAQTLPDDLTALVEPTRNSASGRPIFLLRNRDVLDHVVPGWMEPDVILPSDDIEYLVHDLKAPRQFWVCPAAIEDTEIEVIAGVLPADIPSGTMPTQIETYTALVPLPDIYRSPLIDFVLYRAFSKDAGIAAAAPRAEAHKTLFDTALVAIGGGEAAVSAGANKPPGG